MVMWEIKNSTYPVLHFKNDKKVFPARDEESYDEVS